MTKLARNSRALRNAQIGSSARYRLESQMILCDFNYNDPTFEQMALLWHEYIHFIQSITTSCGIFMQQCLNTRASVIKMLLIKLGNTHNKLYCSLRDWYEDAIEFETSALGLLRKGLRMAENLDNTLAYFGGFPSASGLSPEPYNLGYSFRGTNYQKVAPWIVSSSPTMDIGPRTYGFGGFNLMESSAFFWEIYYRHCILNSRPFTSDILTSIISSTSDWYYNDFSLYIAPIYYVMKELGEAGFYAYPIIIDLALCGPMPSPHDALKPLPELLLNIPKKLKDGFSVDIEIPDWGAGFTAKIDHNDVISSQYVIYESLKQVSTSMSIRINDHYGFQWSWEDVHPGWRFVRIVQELKNKNIANINLSNGMWDEYYNSLVKLVCDKFNWPSPGEAVYNSFETLVHHIEDNKSLAAINEFLKCIEAKVHKPSLFSVFFSPDSLGQLDYIIPYPMILSSVTEHNPPVVYYDYYQNCFSRYINSYLSDIFMPSLIDMYLNRPGDVSLVGKLSCPVANEYFTHVCSESLEIKRLCLIGDFPEGPCYFKNMFYEIFEIKLGEVVYL